MERVQENDGYSDNDNKNDNDMADKRDDGSVYK